MIKSHSEAMADVHSAVSGAADTAYAHRSLGGLNDAKVVSSTWNVAHADYLAVRTELPGADDAWAGWKNRRPINPESSEAVDLANEARAFWAGQRAEVERANEARKTAFIAQQSTALGAGNEVLTRAAWAEKHAAPFWAAGAEIAATAERIAATKPVAATSIYCGPSTAPLGSDAELAAALDAAEVDLACAAAALKAIRGDIRARAKPAA